MKKATGDELKAMAIMSIPIGIKMGFSLMRTFIDKSEQLFSEIKAESEVYDMPAINSMFISNNEVIQHANLTQILRYNTFVSSVTCFESHFNAIAESIVPEHVTLRVSDIKGQN